MILLAERLLLTGLDAMEMEMDEGEAPENEIFGSSRSLPFLPC
jgi:hypothetical protein